MFRSDRVSASSADRSKVSGLPSTKEPKAQAVCSAIVSAVRKLIPDESLLPYPLPKRLPSDPPLKPVDETLLYNLVEKYLKDNPTHASLQPLQPRVVRFDDAKQQEQDRGVQVEVSHHDFHYLFGVFSGDDGTPYLLQGRGARLEDEAHVRLRAGRLDWPGRVLEGRFIHPQLATECPELDAKERAGWSSLPFLTEGDLHEFSSGMRKKGEWRVLPDGEEWFKGTSTTKLGNVHVGVYMTEPGILTEFFREGEMRYTNGTRLVGTFKRNGDSLCSCLDEGQYYYASGVVCKGTFGIDNRLAKGTRTYQGWTWEGTFEWVDELNDVKLKQGTRTPPAGQGPKKTGTWAYIPETKRMELVNGVVIHAENVPMKDGQKGNILTRGEYKYVDELGRMDLVKGDMHLLSLKKEGPVWELVEDLKRMELKKGRTQLPNGQVQVGKYEYIPALKAVRLVEGTIVHLDGKFESGKFAYEPGLNDMHLVDGKTEQHSDGYWTYDKDKKCRVFREREAVKKAPVAGIHLPVQNNAKPALKKKVDVDKKPSGLFTNATPWGLMFARRD